MSLKIVSKSEKPFQIRSKSATKAEILIYDQIGYDWWTGGGVTAKSFKEELDKLDASVNEIHVHINSPGGDVFDGVAIYNLLKQHKAKIIVYIDGLAASISSVIALAGDEVIIGEGALYMIHLPWTFAMGNRMDLDNTVNRLITVEAQLIGIYMKKTGLDKVELTKMLEDETWLDADQAMEKGFVDKKSDDTVAIAASAMDKRWLNKAPRNYTSETMVAKSLAQDTIKKIEERLKARK